MEMQVSYNFSDKERNIIRMALIYLKADCDPADLEDLSTNNNQLNEDIAKLINELTPASWDDDPPPTKGEVKEMQKRREDTGENLRLFRE
jgi:hypothetical protein